MQKKDKIPNSIILLGKEGKTYFAYDPVLSLHCDEQTTTVVTAKKNVTTQANGFTIFSNYLEALDQNIEESQLSPGFFGYFGYEAAALFEPKIKTELPNFYGIPLMVQVLFRRVECYQIECGQTRRDSYFFEFCDSSNEP